jgi:hypothetical protein
MRATLYDKTCRCPSSELARRALAEAHVEYDSLPLDTHPIDATASPPRPRRPALPVKTHRLLSASAQNP